MILLQTFQLLPAPINWLEEFLKSLVVAAPILFVTYVIWQINVYERKKREKKALLIQFKNLSAILNALLYQFVVIFHEIETQEIRFRRGNILYDDEKDKDLKNKHEEALKEHKRVINKLQKDRFKIKSKMTEIGTRLTFYMTETKEREFMRTFTPLDKAETRKFIKEFTSKSPKEADLLAIDLKAKIDKELPIVGVNKLAEHIRNFLVSEIYQNKQKSLQHNGCSYCAYWDYIVWIFC